MEAFWQTEVAAVYGFGVMIKPLAEIEWVTAQVSCTHSNGWPWCQQCERWSLGSSG